MSKANIVDMKEIERLALTYGRPEIRSVEIKGDEYLLSSRLHRAKSRRGEVVMAIARPEQQVLLHTKGWYEQEVFRLPTGGIEREDRVEGALHRELEEETGLRLVTAHFLGVLDCLITYGDAGVKFQSFVFHLPKTEGQLRLPDTEDITEFRAVPISALPQVAEDLRHVSPPRNGWGHWRAIAHDFVYEKLMQS